jgi:hypothetical protein
MDELYALQMDNIFPGEREGELRGGSENFCTTGLGTGEVGTLTEHVSASGTRTFIACANGKIVNVTVGGSPADLGTGFSVNRWQTVDMNGRKLFYNGTDQPQQFDGTTLSNATYTGLTDNDLIQGTVYRNRLYLVPKNSKSFWYGGISAITGALTEFPCESLLKRGGYILFVTTWTKPTNNNSTQNFVVVTSEGEVLVFGGASPEQDGFTLLAQLFISRPLSRRSFINHKSDVEIATITEAVSLSTILSGQTESGALTDKIAPTFLSSAALYSGNFGWEITRYERGRYLIYNIPIVSGSQSHQYIRNSITGAWCRFTGWNASCFALFNDALYFGTFDGKVLKAEASEADRDSAIPYSLMTSYNYFGDRERQKHFKLVRPILTANNDLTVGLAMSTDRSAVNDLDTVTIEAVGGSEWDSFAWDTTPWAGDLVANNDWYAVNGIGRAGALMMAGSAKDVSFNISAFHVTFDTGGLL